MQPILKVGLHLVRTPQMLTLTLGGRVLHRSARSPESDALLQRMDGSRTTKDLIRAVVLETGVPAPTVNACLQRWREAGCLDDLAGRARALSPLTQDQRERLHQDADAWSHACPSATTTRDRLAPRRASWVDVRGAGRLAVGLAHLLTVSAVGHVTLRDWHPTAASTVGPRDVGPLGPRQSEVGSTPIDAVRAIIHADHRATRRRSPAAPDPTVGADLTVIVGPPSTPLADELLRQGSAHLFVHADCGTGVVGPLVVPGSTACGRCARLAATSQSGDQAQRSDEDPTWLDLDGATSTATAALAAAQVLLALEGRERPATAHQVLRINPRQGTVRGEHHVTHPACGCTWPRAEAPEGITMAG